MTDISNCTFYLSDGSSTGISMDSTTPSGSQYVMVQPNRKAKGDIGPRLFFHYVKSKLTTIETSKHQRQIVKLTKLIQKADLIGQFGLSEELSKQLAICVRELEARACGIETYIHKEVINKYIHRVKDVTVKLCSLEEYPRIIENSVHDRIKTIINKNLFDTYHVLYLNYTNSDQPLKTNKKKVIEKDPILFGSYLYAKNKMYFILDWVDEKCDLTMEKLLDSVRDENPAYTVEHIPPVSQDTINKIVAEVKMKHSRLEDTTVDNYKELAIEEQRSTVSRLKGWFKQMFK